MKTYWIRDWICVIGLLILSGPLARAASPALLDQWNAHLNSQLLDYYEGTQSVAPIPPTAATADWSATAKALLGEPSPVASFPFEAGQIRARVQQGIILELAAAIRAGDIERAKALRAELNLPRGVSAAEGTLILQSLGTDKRDDAIRLLVREAITWQTSRVRQLLDEAVRTTTVDLPLPGRLMERLGEAMTLADLPNSLRQVAGLDSATAAVIDQSALAEIQSTPWNKLAPRMESLRTEIESRLPSLLSQQERVRRERLLLKLVQLVPKEYAAGVRDRQVTVPLEYREAVTFTQQARQIVGELAPLWLSDKSKKLEKSIEQLDDRLEKADAQIAAKVPIGELEATLDAAAKSLQDDFGISLRLSGTTSQIVDEIMLETRSLLSRSLSAALAGNWSEAERLRVEAYTTYDPDLEARLMPRDPQLAMDIEHLLIDGLGSKPGVKELLDRPSGHRPTDAELTEAYNAVYSALGKATVLLKSGVSPTAAGMNAASIVLREGLEGLLVVVAIFAGLRGAENAGRRRWFWVGIVGSVFATLVTWALSQTLITSLHAYGEIIAAVTGFLAIGVLLLITNWLFHQVYWKQWVTTLKSQAGQDSSVWQLITVGFLVGYREGFETVLFLQSLVLEAGGKPVAIGVAIGALSLIVLGVAALKIGMKLPYFKILLITALFIGIVLITFVGGTVRAAQTVGWLPVHRLTQISWPMWLGNWLGIYNTCESVAGQALTMVVVLGTWRVARWQAKCKSEKRKLTVCASNEGHLPMAACDPNHCNFASNGQCETHAPDSKSAEPELITISTPIRTNKHLV